MVKFGKRLAMSVNPQWEGHYLEYRQLKKELKKLSTSSCQHSDAEASFSASPSSVVVMTGPKDGHARFQKKLDSEIEKIVLFFLTKQGEFASRLSSFRQQQRATASSTSTESELDTIHALANGYREVGEELVKLLYYVELNATGLRKILKKHDKNHKAKKITANYINSRIESNVSHLQQLYHDEGISAIIASIRAALDELRTLQVQVSTSSQDTPPSTLSRSISEDEPILNRITIARQRLHQSTRYAKTIAAQALIFDSDLSDEEEELMLKTLKLQKPSHISRFLNMFSTFLYMTNYYIVAPTSGEYATLLGGTAALSGIIVGMTPVASMLSAVLYSWWANKSFRHPLLFSSVCLVLGNFLYAIALSYNSITMVLIGRVLNGLGGARSINRRYIADNYSREERTGASAQFVTYSALGMSAGPAMAAVLNYIPDNWRIFGYLITVETSPGWLMFVVWSVYCVATLAFFQEPNHEARDKVNSARSKSAALESGVAPDESTPLTAQPAAPSLGSLWSNVPVVATLIIYVVLKLVLEILITSATTIVDWYFEWSSTSAGIFLAFLGLLMFPANVLVGYLSYRYVDGELILYSEVLLLVGIVGIICYSATYTVVQYVFGAVMIYVFSNVLEGVNMSLLSKTIPKSFARGTFNSGLLATEAGTLGRALGDGAVSLAGMHGIQYVLNDTFIPMAVIALVTIAYTIRVYPHLIHSSYDV
ncbi:hypothetical protein H310_12376 [Aphanomyces invadans]|uniref:SPX domain-containing protein n=1 Tax=Aphanomyces invadans TaxID=157072 RepID=A0A024TKE6_9STRA|nr:hypothetical protein H310_12376 [Aphanomyces invadans]ETV93812.1 hypothetical protein H310_12376 [Aphanomyces invadans]|eukprot:XP_008877621.1 hypothetical protein H310_12376 [Aphanomyces invadans]